VVRNTRSSKRWRVNAIRACYVESDILAFSSVFSNQLEELRLKALLLRRVIPPITYTALATVGVSRYGSMADPRFNLMVGIIKPLCTR
jgi:hypothetical protein